MSSFRVLIGTTAGAAAAILVASSTAMAASLIVGNCNGATYTHIQDAVNAAPRNAHIVVCPGTYYEQVNIPAGKGGLILQGQSTSTVIQYPTSGEIASGPDGSDDVVAITTTSGDNYQLTNFTIRGPWTDDNGGQPNGRHFGVLVLGTGNAVLSQDTITNVIDSNPNGQSAYDGFGAAIGDSFFDDGSEVPGNGTISNSTIENYQQLGVSVTVPGSAGTVKNDVIQGIPGGIPGTSLLGVVLGDGASASVHNNTISDNLDPTASASNTNSQGDGLIVAFTSTPVSLNDNTFSHNDVGLEILQASGVKSANDKLQNGTFDGIRVDPGSSGNSLANDQASSNKEFDCEDDTTGTGTAGTADTWTNDQGSTMTPPGICKH